MADAKEEALRPVSPNPLWASKCTVCQDIWKLFFDPESVQRVNLGSFEEALSTTCAAHKCLVEAFATHCGHPNADTQDIGLISGGHTSSVHMTESISRGGQFWDLLLVKDASEKSHPGKGRILDPDWVDLDMLKQWKHNCLALHGKSCDNPMKIWASRPAWLIDVQRRCLVPGQVPGNFVALSYMYGNLEAPHIDADMLANLQKPLALDNPEIARILPPIVQHAIYLTGVIGELYLWVDALCIPRCNPEVTKEQLEMMGAIYATAVVTIIAADGDASDGLRGLRGVSTSRGLDQSIIPFGDEQLLVRNTGFFSMGSGLPYYDRGWTYQEYKMSPRRILFNERELHWECSCSVWHEELVLGAEVDKYIDHRLKIILAGFPDLSSLSNIIGSYNTRTLRYDEDALPGITGLFSVLSRSFTGGFLYGLPTMLFDRVLGWSPHWKFTNLRRRTESSRSTEDRLSPSGLPSWSWIGWQGLVYIGSEAALINSRSNWANETTPITEWYTGRSSQTPPCQRQRVRSTWFENRQDHKDFTKQLPAGWARHDAPRTVSFPEEPFLYPHGCDRYIFKHDNMPPGPYDNGNEDGTWHFPFPVPEIQESVLPSMPEQTPYLFCDTVGTTLWGHQSGDGNMVRLCNGDGEVIGWLHLHNADMLAHFPTAVTRDKAGLPVELVAIYKSTTYYNTWDEPKERYGLPLRRREEYTVLWIEWKNGVACRQASGRIEADKWDALKPGAVSLVLN